MAVVRQSNNFKFVEIETPVSKRGLRELAKLSLNVYTL